MTRKGGLGKGLDALIPTGNEFSESGSTFIPSDKIIPNPRQPRHKMSEDSLADLAASIREHGILQPLIVTHEPDDENYILIAGERRLRASRLAGLKMVPVIIRQATEQQRLELALIENVQRSDLTPLETAEAYRQLSEDFQLSHEEVATRVGKSRVAVTNTLRLLKLPDLVRQALAEEKISEGHARALLGLTTATAQISALTTVLVSDLTVRQTEDLVRRLNGERKARLIAHPVEPEIEALEERLRGFLGTKVTLNHGKKGGSLVIHYYSDEELNGLIGRILKE